MKRTLATVGVAAACGVCCAIPVALPPLAGLAASGTALAADWGTTVVGSFAGLALLLTLVRWRGRRAHGLAAGYGLPKLHGSAEPATLDRGEEAPAACTPSCSDRRHQISAIASLARRALLAHHQCGPSLYLRYSAAAAGDLARLLAQEQKDCPFLDFELTHHGDAVHLVITRPATAAGFAPALTAHFLGNPVSTDDCAASCGCLVRATADAA